MNLFTILAFVCIVFFWSRALLRYRDGSISLGEMALWSIIWAAAAIVIGSPKITGLLAHQIGIGRGADVVVYISIILTFYLLFRLYIKVGLTERQLTRLVRSIALKEADDK